MNRLLYFSVAAAPLLADASLKGAALLVLAGVYTLVMRRASAASRHMVWLAAVVALLVLPVLALVLPGWRVLPQWAVLDAGVVANDGKNASDPKDGSVLREPSPAMPLQPTAAPEVPAFPEPVSSPPSHVSPSSPSSHYSQPQQPPTTMAAVPAPAPPATLTAWLFPLWAAGCVALLLRLAAAHVLLLRNTRRCEPATGPLAAAFEAARVECGVCQPVRLLLDEGRTIPVVWGVFRPQLLLPGEAAHWDATRLRSVLLHELAHLRRRDPLTQLLTQLACALHWFNPLVWLAAWRSAQNQPTE